MQSSESLWPRIFMLILIAVSSGCSRLTLLTTDDLPSEIDQAIEAQDFRLADYLIRGVGENHPDHDAAKAKADILARAMAAFQQQARDTATEQANRQDWWGAQQTLAQAAKQLPDTGQVVSEAQQTLAQRQQDSFEALEARILLQEASWLISQENDARLLENYTLRTASRLAQTLAQRTEALTERLYELAERPCQEDQWQRCHDLLSTWQTLSPDQPEDPRLASASAQLASAAHRDRQRQAQQLLRQAQSLHADYESSNALEDLLALRQFVDTNNRQGALDALATETARLCVERFDNGLRRGEAFYAQGQYQQALDSWLAIQPLFPNNSELEKKLARVYRVLDNLQRLGASES